MRYARISFNLEKPGRTRPPATSALPCLITFLCPVDDIYSALAPHQLVGAVARAQGFQRVADFHRRVPKKTTGLGAGWKRRRDLCPIRRRQSTLKTNVRNADNEFWRGLAFIGLPKNAGTLGHKTVCFSGRRRRGGSPSFVIRRREIAFPLQGSCFRETERRTARHSLVAAGWAVPR
jgi:hypothetical protein